MSELRRSQILEMEEAGKKVETPTDGTQPAKKKKKRRKKKPVEQVSENTVTSEAIAEEAVEVPTEEPAAPEEETSSQYTEEDFEKEITGEANKKKRKRRKKKAEDSASESEGGENSEAAEETPEEKPVREGRRRAERMRDEEIVTYYQEPVEDNSTGAKIWRAFRIIDFVLLGIMLVAYLGVTIYYWNKFMPNTLINGVDVSGKTVEEVQSNLKDWSDNYKIAITDRNGNTEYIKAKDIDYHYTAKGEVVNMKKVQNPFTWPVHLFKLKEYSFNTLTTFNEKKLRQVVSKLGFMQDMISPENAYVSFDENQSIFTVVPEILGTELKVEDTQETIKEWIEKSEKTTDLLEADLYVKPTQYTDDADLVRTCNTLNTYASTRIVYLFGDEQEVLDGNVIRNWLTYNSDGSGEVYFDSSQIANYVENLAAKYDTQYQPHTFTSYYGNSVTVTKGDYGWKIDQEAEIAEVYELITSGTRTEREPVYEVQAQSRRNADLGDTYVEVDLGNQMVYLWIDGEMIASSSCVSGTYYASDRVTPSGIYSIYYKQSPAVLVGANNSYRSNVTFWMPFNGGIGLHDASWRSVFGGDIYLYSGSHGCINLPYSMASTIYEYAYQGMPFICYYE